MIVHYSLYKYVNIHFTVGENCKVHVAFSVVMINTIFIIYVITIYLIYFNVALTGQSGQFDLPVYK